MLDQVIRFFDLYSQYRTPQSKAEGIGDDDLALWRQIVVYAACAIGIVVGPYALDAATGTYATFWTMFGSGIRLFWAALFGFVITALLFKTVLTPKTSLVVQIGTAVVAGFASGKLIPKAIALLLRGAGDA
jgi:hypothetical protein